MKEERSGRLQTAAFNFIGGPIIDGCAGIDNTDSKFQSKRDSTAIHLNKCGDWKTILR